MPFSFILQSTTISETRGALVYLAQSTYLTVGQDQPGRNSPLVRLPLCTICCSGGNPLCTHHVSFSKPENVWYVIGFRLLILKFSSDFHDRQTGSEVTPTGRNTTTWSNSYTLRGCVQDFAAPNHERRDEVFTRAVSAAA